MTDMEQFVETKIYCQVSRYAETVQVNCLLEQNQGRRKLKLEQSMPVSMPFESACDILNQFLQLFDSSPLKSLICI